jgi:CheY-like chemotaxis protein
MSAAAVAPIIIESPQTELPAAVRACTQRVLVVDDSPDITDMLAILLHQTGYEVSAAYSASDGLIAALRKHFDIIISDIGMPGMDGYELARALRGVPEYSNTLLVAMTGFDMYNDRDRALEAGFNDHLRKPIDSLSLTQIIRGVWH